MILSKQEQIDKIKEWLTKSELDAGVLKQTLGAHYEHITPQMLLQASKKLIRINKLEIPPDDRDNLKYSNFLGIEDFVKEKIEKDAGGYQRKAKMKLQQKRNLGWLHASFFTPQVRSV